LKSEFKKLKKIHIRDEFAEHINIFFFPVQFLKKKHVLKHYLEHGLCKAQNNKLVKHD